MENDRPEIGPVPSGSRTLPVSFVRITSSSHRMPASRRARVTGLVSIAVAGMPAPGRSGSGVAW